MGFTTEGRMVRVDFFKPSGKWYTTEAVRWTGDYDKGLIHQEFAKSLFDHLKERETQPGLQHESHRVFSLRLMEMTAVCLEPYHQYAHPLMLAVSDVENCVSNGFNLD